MNFISWNIEWKWQFWMRLSLSLCVCMESIVRHLLHEKLILINSINSTPFERLISNLISCFVATQHMLILMEYSQCLRATTKGRKKICINKCDIEWLLCVHFSVHNEQSLGEFRKLNFQSWNSGIQGKKHVNKCAPMRLSADAHWLSVNCVHKLIESSACAIFCDCSFFSTARPTNAWCGNYGPTWCNYYNKQANWFDFEWEEILFLVIK